jgi:glycosyltransferase involved in cell wall biosynthesis
MADNGQILVAAGHSAREGGAEAHVLSSVEALAASGHDVTLVVGSASYSNGWSFERFPSERLRVLEGIGRRPVGRSVADDFLSLVAELRPQAVHFHDAFDADLPVRTRELAPVVWSTHNFAGCTSGYKYFRRPGDECTRPHGPGCIPHLLVHGCAHARDPRPFPARYRETTARLRGLRCVDAQLAHSRFMVAHLRSNRLARVRHVPLFVPRPAAAAPLPQIPRVLFVGRVTPAKGLDVLVQAIARLDVRLEVCGDGWGLPRARQLASRLEVGERVTFHGRVPPFRMSEHYARSTVVAVPSLWPEPFGLVGLEAMGQGRPVVASATGGIPEWLVDGETGFLVPPGDPDRLAQALEDLLTDAARCESMGRAGEEHVAHNFSRERYLAAVLDAYQDARRHWETSTARPNRPAKLPA